MIQLPSTWQRIRLGKICEINPRLPLELQIEDDTALSFIPMSSVNEILGEITSPEERQYFDVKKGFTSFVENDVLFAKITPSMENGKTAIARKLRNSIGFGSTEFHVLRCSNHILPEFVFYFIRQPIFREWAKSSFIGSAGQQRVPQAFLERIPILLPTVPEQQHIVNILSLADALRNQREAIFAQVEQLPMTLFVEIFGDPKSSGVRKIKLGDITDVVTSGSRNWARYYSSLDNDAKFIRVQNIKSGEIDLSDVAFVNPPENIEAERAKIQSGDLLISITGTVGQVAIATKNLGEAYISQHVALARTDGTLPIEFLIEFLNHPAGGQLQIQRANYGQTKPGLNLQQIKDLMIPVFDTAKVKRFIAAKAEIVSLRRSLQATTFSVEQLYEKALQQAFSGELTSRWREAHRAELEFWLNEHAELLPAKAGRISVTVTGPPERTIPSRAARHWLMEQLSVVQMQVYEALREWKGTLIPAEYLNRFLEQWPLENLENGHDQVLRALDQLAGLGLIARVSIPNDVSEYVSGYRMLRENELSRHDDFERLRASA